MLQMNRMKSDAGFSLLESLVSIVVFALVVTAVGSSLVMAHRINARSEVLMQEQLKVSRTVEAIMARGIPATTTSEKLAELQGELKTEFEQEDGYDVVILIDWGTLGSADVHTEKTKSFYDVVIRTKVTELQEDVWVRTHVRAVEGVTE